MKPGSTVICDRSITRAPFAWLWICASGPTALMRSPSMRIPTPDCGASDRPSIRRPALTRTVAAGGLGAWAASDVYSRTGTARCHGWRMGRVSCMRRGESPPNLVAVKAFNLRAEVHMATTATAPEPKVSAAEAREVAEAAREQEWAAPSFVRDLFLGRLRLELIHPYPEQDAEETRRAQPFLERLERLLRDRVDSDKIDREGEIPDDVIRGLRDLGAFGIKIPREYGGLGLSQLSYMKAIELVSSIDGSITALLSAHQSIGVPGPLKMFGTDEQKKRFL